MEDEGATRDCGGGRAEWTDGSWSWPGGGVMEEPHKTMQDEETERVKGVG